MDLRRTVAKQLAASLVAALVTAGCGMAPPLLYEGERDHRIEPIEMYLIRIDREEIAPATLELPENAGGVAFLNATEHHVAILFERPLAKLRCSYTVGFARDDERTFTERPIAPGGLASLCLHDRGTLRFEVHGAPGAPLEGVIRVGESREGPSRGRDVETARTRAHQDDAERGKP